MALSDLENIVHHAMACGLVGPEKRRQLLEGLPMGFVYSLPTVSRPIDQLRFDLMELNRTPRLIGLDAPPLAVWLKNAAQIAATTSGEQTARFFAARADALYAAGGAQEAVDVKMGRAQPPSSSESLTPGTPSPQGVSTPRSAEERGRSATTPSSERATYPRGKRMTVLSMHPDAEHAWQLAEPPFDPADRRFAAPTPPDQWYFRHPPHATEWKTAVSDLDQTLTRLRDRAAPRDCLAVFAIGPPALGALLGARLRERLRKVPTKVIFDEGQSDDPSWRPWGPAWSSKITPRASALLEVSYGSQAQSEHVALLVELSDTLHDHDVKKALARLGAGDVPRVTVAFEPQPSVRFPDPVAIETAVRDLRGAIEAIGRYNKRIRHLHVFYTGPLALMIRAADALAARRFRSIVYTQRRDDGYVPAVELGGVEGASLALPAHIDVGRRDGDYDVFIAHAGADSAFANQLHDALEARGKRVFLDARKLAWGDDWTTVIPAALERSRHVIALISAATPEAWYDKDEFIQAIDQTRASGGHRRLIPILLDGTAEPTYGMRRIQALNLEDLPLHERDPSALAEKLAPLLTGPA